MARDQDRHALEHAAGLEEDRAGVGCGMLVSLHSKLARYDANLPLEPPPPQPPTLRLTLYLLHHLLLLCLSALFILCLCRLG